MRGWKPTLEFYSWNNPRYTHSGKQVGICQELGVIKQRKKDSRMSYAEASELTGIPVDEIRALTKEINGE